MDIFGYLVVLLFALALIDLVVGVSNDAVNFLNSAIGSKVASFRTILIIASAGIIMGSVFSEGMMQIARSGIFHPSFFNFNQVMVILLAVILTDIILLDSYNSFGLPTSTTVSIIFELLGASFAVGIVILWVEKQSIDKLSEFLNYKNALFIIGGIFLSIFISFIVGSAVQYFVRLLFTFHFDKQVKRWGAPFAGLALATIVYFLLIKGAAGSAIIAKEQVVWIYDHTVEILLVAFVLCTVMVWWLMRSFKVHPLKLVVLMGTFSLAMAFAGNDLVNFIGVSVAGLNAFQAWSTSQVPADTFNMGILNEKLPTPFWILLISGIVMTITIWTNAKSRKVTETEVSLGSQDEGDERFTAGNLSRWLVGGTLLIGNGIVRMFPRQWSRVVSKRFHRKEERKINPDKPSFDLVRASINLVVASALIALGTSKKLPLSTTYVTFMVAMGSSFADQAWGRESAVYRVAGVIRVISGWLLTALLAFVGSATVAFIIYFTGLSGIILLTVLALLLILFSHVQFKKKRGHEKKAKESQNKVFLNSREVINESKKEIVVSFKNVEDILKLCFTALRDSKVSQLKKSKKALNDLMEENNKLNNKIIKYIGKLEKAPPSVGRNYLMVFDRMQNIHQSCLLIVDVCINHVSNHHPRPDKDYLSTLRKVEGNFHNLMKLLNKSIQSLDFNDKQAIRLGKNSLQTFIEAQLDIQVTKLQQGKLGSRIGLLQTRMLLEINDILREVLQIYNMYEKLSAGDVTPFK